MVEKKNTFFIDIDGTILEYVPFDKLSVESAVALPNTVEWIRNKRADGHMVILTTARPEGYRELTEKQMEKIGIEYDRLIMGLNRGIRTLINDVPTEYESPNKAVAVNVKRNEGFGSI